MAHFDAVAADYDRVFTHSETGKRQRAAVYFQLEPLLQNYDVHRILELNGGTGEDALYFARQHIAVLTTDMAPEMVRLATQKAASAGLSQWVEASVCAFSDIDRLAGEPSFDMIFSNFGGLNCLPPADFPDFIRKAGALLRPGGLFVAVVMPRFCLWETLYFISRGKVGTAFRRWRRRPVSVPLDAQTSIDTWYYSPAQMKVFFSGWKPVAILPIGFFLPPSYLELFFKRRIALLNRLAGAERYAARCSILAGGADHMIVVFEKKV